MKLLFVSVVVFGVLVDFTASWSLFGGRQGSSKTFEKCNVTSSFMICFEKGINEISSGKSFIGDKILKVDLSLNNIQKLFKGNFTGGKKVKELKLSHNQISYIGPSSFINFEGLNTLYLDNNRLHKLDKDILKGLSYLQYLYIGYNSILSIDPEIFAPVSTSLESLSLRKNPLLTLKSTVSFMVNLPELTSLDLSSTNLQTIPEAFFPNDTKLKKLKISNNNFSNLPLPAINKLSNLQLMDISFNPTKSLPSMAFYALENLKILVMDNMSEMSVLREGVFDGLVNLQSLYCSYSYKLYMLHRWAFFGKRPVRRLRELILKGNALTTLHEDTLPWNDIKTLDLSYNPWNCDCRIAWMANLRLRPGQSRDMQCARPDFLFGAEVLKVKPREFMCLHESSYTSVIAIIFIAAILIMITITTFVFLSFRYKLCKRLRASHQAEYKALNNKVEIIMDSDELDKKKGSFYGANDMEVGNSDDEDCHYTRDDYKSDKNESVA